jgi:glycosyltransferase involved in cell wall biosynthesis
MDLQSFVSQLNSVIQPQKAGGGGTAVSQVITPAVAEIVSSNSKKVKIMIVSTHINQANGYSKVAMNIINELAAHDWISVVHFGTQKILNGDLGRKYPPGVKVIDGSALEKQKQAGFAFTELPAVINSERPDIVLIYNDIAVICGYIEEIRKAIQERFFRIWAYMDIVYQSPPQTMIDIINRDVERIFCFTKGWKEHIKSQGITRSVDVMTHGIDGKVIRGLPRDLARQSIGLPKDVFLFSSLNKNIPRKRLDLLIMAFVKCIVKFPMKPIFMLVVADKGDKGGYHLFDIFARELKLAGASVEQLGNRLLITSSGTCYKDDDINLINNCADVGVSCAEGEGFGLCSFEQMALGIPQIVPHINGYAEYCNDGNSIMIKPRGRYYIPQAYNPVCGEAHVVDAEDVAKAMERYVFDEELRKMHGAAAKTTVGEYTWNKCVASLVKRLKAVQEDDD